MSITRTLTHRGYKIEVYDDGARYAIPELINYALYSMLDVDLYIDIKERA